MIKKVTLYNFESHENTTINFSHNFNLIVGESNSGKSAIIRAIGVVVNNNWDKDMVRTNCDFCRVTVETERGWVEAERGEKINRWRCQENGQEIQTFKNVGNKVPDLATKILGMGERERGNDIKELPNFQFQLEKHYMLSEIGEKKATSNMIARMMDNAIGLGGMEDLIKDISTDLLKDKKWLTEKQNEISELKSSIIDEKIFKSYSSLIEKISNKYESIEVLDGDIEAADKYNNAYNKIFLEKQENQKLLESLSCVDKLNLLKDKLDLLTKKIEIFNKSYINVQRIQEISSILNVDTEKLKNKMEILQKNNKIIDSCEKALKNSEELSKVRKTLDIDINLLQEKRDNLITKLETIKKAEKELANAREIWLLKRNSEKEYKSTSAELNNSIKEYEKLKDELGFCPLCGEKLK